MSTHPLGRRGKCRFRGSGRMTGYPEVTHFWCISQLGKVTKPLACGVGAFRCQKRPQVERRGNKGQSSRSLSWAMRHFRNQVLLLNRRVTIANAHQALRTVMQLLGRQTPKHLPELLGPLWCSLKLWGLLWGPQIENGIIWHHLCRFVSRVQSHDDSGIKQTVAISISFAEVAWGARGRQFKSARPDH
jgi:hypothetical protein